MKLRVLILLPLVVLAACHRESGKAPVAAPKPRAGALKAAAGESQQSTAGMVEAVTQGRSQAPVALKFDLPQRPVQGQPLEVVVALVPQIAANLASVQVTGSDGLALEEADQQFQFPGVEASQVYRRSIKVTPASEGLYLLTLSVSLQHDQIADARVFSVPILVEAAKPAAAAHQGS